MAPAGSRPQSCVVRHERLALRSSLAQEAGTAVWLWATGTVSGGGGVGGTIRCPAGLMTLINLQYVVSWTQAGFPGRQAWFTSCCVPLGT